ncbi:hypothetical protein [Paraflavitalea speifideaquila]|uniref:hypothetical protein n=1 Tax=Paraflavitalea speifideaquila TaxID=3076558 RepID=UPI0028E2DB56|nr:hypothetical protein [Paraflavitalea speifideiaquila]
MYTFIRQLLFLFPTEGVHYFSMNALKLACKVGFIKRIVSKKSTPARKGLEHELFGLHFKIP